MPHTVLINVFEVPEGRDDEFLAHWSDAKRFMEQQRGYISTALHRSLDPTARFRYINVAVWATPADFQAAVRHPEFVKLREATPFASYPSLYEVVQT